MKFDYSLSNGTNWGKIVFVGKMYLHEDYNTNSQIRPSLLTLLVPKRPPDPWIAFEASRRA